MAISGSYVAAAWHGETCESLAAWRKAKKKQSSISEESENIGLAARRRKPQSGIESNERNDQRRQRSMKSRVASAAISSWRK